MSHSSTKTRYKIHGSLFELEMLEIFRISFFEKLLLEVEFFFFFSSTVKCFLSKQNKIDKKRCQPPSKNFCTLTFYMGKFIYFVNIAVI